MTIASMTAARLNRLSLGAIALIACLLGASQADSAQARNWRINPARTSVGFVVDGIGWPRTKGRFRDFDGRISINFDNPAASRVSFKVAATSVDVGSPSFNDYLRTDAFFNVAQYPTITFTSTKVEKVDGSHARVTGDLTIRGITRPLTIDVALDKPADRGSSQIGFRATGVIKRLAFNMSAGFPAISNDVDLIVTTEAQAQ
ncbi:YceI family protein [Labrys sp. KNU-23]|uniref:YceI family protein n=1 Tax=Labrys sp. KNU-23 TaxID=2789216 RepID=UPI00165C28F5|nr:YceI family protein [Labrys sp. KNU-23]